MKEWMRMYFDDEELPGGGGGEKTEEPPKEPPKEPKEFDITEDDEGKTKILVKPEYLGSKKKPGSEEEDPGKEKPEFSAEFLEKVKGKSQEELIKMLNEKESFTGKQSTQIGQLRNVIGKALSVTSTKEIEADISKIGDKISKLDEKIEELDETDDALEYGKLSKDKDTLLEKKGELEKKFNKLQMEETVKEIYAKEHNEELCEKVRKQYLTDIGIEFQDEQWGIIVKIASKFSPGPKLTEEDIESALIRALTLPVYNKMKSAQTEANVREQIKKATGQETMDIGKEHPGKTTPGLVAADFLSLTKEQQAEILDKLPYEKKKGLYKLLDED